MDEIPLELDLDGILAKLRAAEQRAEIEEEKRLIAEQYGQQRARLAAEYKRRAEEAEQQIEEERNKNRELDVVIHRAHLARLKAAEQRAAEAKPVIQKLIDVVNEMWGYDDILLPTTAKEWKDLANKINSAQADAAK